MKKGKQASYGPELTAAQELALRAEIAAFDKKAALAEIEREALSRPDKQIEVFNDADQFSTEDAVNLDRPVVDPEVEMAKFEVDEILSHRQKQVWRLCMRQGYSQEEAAEQLNITQQAVAGYLKSAEAKVRKHFESKGVL